MSCSRDKRETFLEINKYFFFLFSFRALHLPVKYKRQMSGGGWAGEDDEEDEIEYKDGGEREVSRPE